MILTYDVGSLPFHGDIERYNKGLKIHPLSTLLHHKEEGAERAYFEDHVIQSLVDKLNAGISIPNYPQFQDMNEMFLNQIDGITKTPKGYQTIDRLSISEKKSTLPEIAVIREREREISEKTHNPFTIKICITGPYTLTSLFVDRRGHLFKEFGEALTKFIDTNIFCTKFGRVALISIDEPVFGTFDDPLLDYGSNGREQLLVGWETICQKIKSKGMQSAIHLHNTTNDLFWQVKSLDIIESHVHDSLYSSLKTAQYLKQSDKKLKASICLTDFNTLLMQHTILQGKTREIEIGQHVADEWTKIHRGEIQATQFLEDTDVLLSRLQHIVHLYGDKVLYAGPECGLKSFPTYESAIECLRRVAQATDQFISTSDPY